MPETEKPPREDLAQELERKREQRGLEPLDWEDFRRRQLASVTDPEARREAADDIGKMEEQETESEHAREQVDIMEVVEQYSDTEKKYLFSNLFAFKTTDGCWGGCPFCSMRAKRGVKAQFTPDSLARFSKKYGGEIPRGAVPWYDNDFFDHERPQAVFDARAWNFTGLSTSLPRGSEGKFLDFTREMFRRHQQDPKNGSGCFIRLSVGEHNVRRIEAVIKKLRDELLAQGVPPEGVAEFFQNNFRAIDRFAENVTKVGYLIKEHDDIRGAADSGPGDGVVLGPEGFSARIAVARTIYNPTGEVVVPLLPGLVEEQVPRHCLAHKWSDPNSNLLLVATDPFLPFPANLKGERYHFPDPEADVIMQLGRAATSLHRFVRLSRLEELVRYLYTPGARTAFQREIKPVMEEELSRAQKLMETSSSEAIIKELHFYQLLARVQLMQVEYLLESAEKGNDRAGITRAAKVLAGVNKDNVNDLPGQLAVMREAARTPKRKVPSGTVELKFSTKTDFSPEKD